MLVVMKIMNHHSEIKMYDVRDSLWTVTQMVQSNSRIRELGKLFCKFEKVLVSLEQLLENSAY